MALPTDLSGAGIPRNSSNAARDVRPRAGPFKVGSAFYYFAVDATNVDQLNAYKSTDPTSSWTEQTQITLMLTSDAIFTIGCVVAGTTIHIACGSFDNDDVRYVSYNTSTDAFGTAETIEAVGNFEGAGGNYSSIEIIENSGDLYVTGTMRNRDMGTTYTPFGYWKKPSGGSWSSFNLMSASSLVFSAGYGSVIDADGKIHCFFRTTNQVHHRSINTASSDALSGVETVNDTSPVTMTLSTMGRPNVYSSGGTERVTMLFLASAITRAVEIEDDGSPGAEENVFGSSEGNNCPVLANDGTNLHALVQRANIDLWRNTNDDGGGWGTEAEEDTAPSVLNFLSANIYDRSGTKLGYVYYVNGTTLRYDEIDIGVAAAPIPDVAMAPYKGF